MERMSLNRILANIKLTDKKIEKTIQTAHRERTFTSLKRGKDLENKSEFEKNSLSTLNSLKGLFAYRAKLKSALTKANAETEVKIAGKKYTIAEAVELKSSIHNFQDLLDTLVAQKRESIQLKTAHVRMVEDRLNDFLKSSLGNASKTNTEAVKVLTENFYADNMAEIVCGFDMDEEIKELEEMIIDFTSEVDLALTEVNATTFVEIA